MTSVGKKLLGTHQQKALKDDWPRCWCENQTALPLCWFPGRPKVPAHCGPCVQEQMLPPNLWILISQLENIYWAPALQASLGETKMPKIKPGHCGAGRPFLNGKTVR